MASVIKNAEILLVNTATNAGTVTMPLTSQVSYRLLTVKDVNGTFSQRNLTLSTQGPDTFEDGTTTMTVNSPAAFLTFYAVTASSKWVLVGGTNQYAQTISSLTVNTINNQAYIPVSPINLVSTALLASSLQSTIRGLGTIGYISSIGSSVDPTNLVSTSLLASSLQSTVRGLGTIGYISSPPLQLSTSALFTSSLLASTISTTNTVFTNALVARSTNLSSVFVSNLTGTQGYISAFTTDSLTIGDGNGWFDVGALRAVVVSSVQQNTGSMYATTAFIGNTSTLNQIRFWGLFGNYNNTILAEVSTGSVVGAQEFLVFKGSSASDRIRFQTTGDIRFEPQVSAREFSTATALATPTMILQSNLVGIATATPATTLDVGGTIRGTIISTLAFNVSSINGTIYSVPSFLDIVSTPFLNTALRSTVANLGQIYLSTVIPQSFLDLVSTPFLDTALRSTVANLGQIYLSSATAASFLDLVSTPFLDTALQSTVANLGQIYLSTGGGGGGGITTGNLVSTVEGLGTVNYISGPHIVAKTVFGSEITGGSVLTASTLYIANDFLATEFPAWNSSNQISGSDPEPAPLAVDIFGSARILKNLYVGSTTTILTTAGIETSQVLATKSMTLVGKGPIIASTNTVTGITDMFLNDYYVAQTIPIKPLVVSTLFNNMILQPEFLGMHFLLTNGDSNYASYIVRADLTNYSFPDGWYCYLKQDPDPSLMFMNTGVDAEVDVPAGLGNIILPTTYAGTIYSGSSNFQAPMKFIISGGKKFAY